MVAKRDETAPPAHPLLTRREAMRRIGETAAATVVCSGAGIWLLNRDPFAPEVLEPVPDHRVERPAGAVEMSIVRGPDPAANARAAVAALGGMESFVKKGERVMLKPNVGWNRTPQQAANTNPEVLAEIVRLVLAAGAAEVWVTDFPMNNPERCFTRSKIAETAAAAGAEVVMPTMRAFRPVAVSGGILTTAEVLWPLVEADRVINLPVVKQHSLSVATMAMKNWYGVLGGHRARLHQKIDQSIVDLHAMVKPTLTVMDATAVLMSNGPSGGSLNDVKRYDTVAAGVDELALDAFGATLLGKQASDLGYLTIGREAGLGTTDYRSLKLVEERLG